MKTDESQTTKWIVSITRTGLIAGVIVAAVLYPLAAVTGLGAKVGAGLIGTLPSDLKIAPSAQASYVYAADGKTLITKFYEEYRHFTPIGKISPWVTRAIVASEDSRFYEHNGVDLKGIVRAFIANQRAGEVAQGASTLTMQYVRNVQRDSAISPQEVVEATEQTSRRKLREMRLAVAVEQRMTKTQILEAYLNVAYFGHRAYGIHAAAEVYFSKRPAELTLTEAAMLAGLVKAPSSYDPVHGERTAFERRNYVIDRMTGLGYVRAGTAERAKRTPINLRLTDPPNDCTDVSRKHNSWGFFCDMFKNWWRAQQAFGDTPSLREENLRRGGYRIVTTLDPKIQKIAMREIREKERIGSTFALGVVAIEPGTGKIKAAAVNRRYSMDQHNNGPHTDRRKLGVVPSNYPNTVNPLLGGGDLPGYQAGSTFKVFTMAAALEQGLPLSTSIHSPLRVRTRYLAGLGEPSSCGIWWCPQSANKAMVGRQSIWSGFGKSVNTFFVQLEERIGAKHAVRMAERLGLTWHTDIDRLQASPAKANGWGSFTLGVADTTPLEMANAYATFAADGRFCEPWPVLQITGSDGRDLVDAATPNCHQAVRKQVARGVIDAARCVTGYGAAAGPCGGWSTAPGVYGTVGRPVAGKTGTTDDTRAAWFVGMTPGLAAAAFIADPDNPFHVAGDWNSQKPVMTVANLLRDGLAGTTVLHFTPPTLRTAYGHSWNGRGWGRGQFGQSPWDRQEEQRRATEKRKPTNRDQDDRRPGARRR